VSATGTSRAGERHAPDRAGLGAGAGLAASPDRVAEVRDRLPTAEDAARLASLLSIMAEPVRLRLLYALDLSEELRVGDLALALGASEDQATYGLRLLRTAGLVTARKQGRSVPTGRGLPRTPAGALPAPAHRPHPPRRRPRRRAAVATGASGRGGSGAARADDGVGDEAGTQADQQAVGDQVGALGAGRDPQELGRRLRSAGPGSGGVGQRDEGGGVGRQQHERGDPRW
jgi:DNA-binding transcriptional ArsR family regulator